MEQKSERILKAKDAMEKNRMLLEKHQEDARRKEEEETRKCEEEVARQNRINVARANLEMKLAEKGKLACLSLVVVRGVLIVLIPFLFSMHFDSEFSEEVTF